MKKLREAFSHIIYNCNHEIKAILHDSGALLILFLALIIYPIIYSFAYKNEVLKESEIAIIDLDNTSTSRTCSRMINSTEQIHVTYKLQSMVEAQKLFFEGKIKGIIVIPRDFEKNIMYNKQSQVVVYADASYVLIYKQIYTGAAYATSTLGAGIEIKRLIANKNVYSQTLEKQSPLDISTYQLYNPAGGYGSFVMPAIILIVMQQTLLIGIGLVGATFKERNKKNSLRGGYFTIVVGKTFAYLGICIVNSLTALLIIYSWFNYPDKSGFLPTLFVLIPFFLSTIFLGLAISTLFKNRINSLLFLVFLSPIVLFLSGVSWPIEAIPSLLYNASHVFPSSFAVPAYLKLRIQGTEFNSYRFEWFGLLIQMILYFIIALISYKIQLKKAAKVKTIQVTILEQ